MGEASFIDPHTVALPDGQHVRARFAITARDETELDALLAELARVRQETMQPETVSVWIKPHAHRSGEA